MALQRNEVFEDMSNDFLKEVWHVPTAELLHVASSIDKELQWASLEACSRRGPLKVRSYSLPLKAMCSSSSSEKEMCMSLL